MLTALCFLTHTGAGSFFAAIAQVKEYFPEGICCDAPVSSVEYKVCLIGVCKIFYMHTVAAVMLC